MDYKDDYPDFITKGELAEQVLLFLSKGNTPNDFAISKQELITLVPQVRDYLIDQAMQKKGVELDEQLLRAFEVKVRYDKNRDVNYCVIPVPYLSLPNNMGLYSISPMKGDNVSFINVSPKHRSIYSGMDALRASSRIGYYTENTGGHLKAIFTKKFNSVTEGCEVVLMKLIEDIRFISDDESIYVPSGLRFTLITTLVGYLTGEIKIYKNRINEVLAQ